jgi:hypothetical protein
MKREYSKIIANESIKIRRHIPEISDSDNWLEFVPYSNLGIQDALPRLVLGDSGNSCIG